MSKLSILRACNIACILLNLGHFHCNADISGPGWSYQRTEDWELLFPNCSMKSSAASPINFPKNAIIFSDLPPFVSRDYNEIPIEMKLENNGHTVMFTAQWFGRPPSLKGGPLNGNYEFVQGHFHWGTNDRTGSEHTVDGKWSSLELHLVHFKTDYCNADIAMLYEDGLAVLGLLYRVEDSLILGNRALNVIADNIVNVLQPNSAVNIEPFSLRQLGILPEFWLDSENQFFVYKGSLTTPPCSEVVTWLVKEEEMLVDKQFMSAIRQVQMSSGDLFNNRPVQALHNRVIKRTRFVDDPQWEYEDSRSESSESYV